MSAALAPWAIEPRDLLAVRDAASNGNRMKSLPFPSPSTVAGCVRAQLGPVNDDWSSVLDLEVAGPWLLELDERGSSRPLAPAPRDCLWAGGETSRLRLVPGQGTGPSNLPAGLLPVVIDGGHDGSKLSKGPAFWSWEAMQAWLVDPGAAPAGSVGPTPALTSEWRTHVALDPATGTAQDGKLFSVEGLRFSTLTRGREARRFGLGLAVAGPRSEELRAGLVRLGGEGRVSRLAAMGELPRLSDSWMTRLIQESGRWRVVLLTPGIFAEGWRPSDERLEAFFGEGARLVAACVDRPQVVSGWDFVAKKPKASRRAAPAGSVYWIESPLPGRDLLERVWLRSLCDDEQDRRDGFGRMLLGVGA
ncbi:MAG: CRISPR-associated protein Cmr3 [Myxococcales bacterium]|nr:CRISPR-associated protein Cmr3 [Myxococcales bacterium]